VIVGVATEVFRVPKGVTAHFLGNLPDPYRKQRRVEARFGAMADWSAIEGASDADGNP
jgi:hypothetical protein